MSSGQRSNDPDRRSTEALAGLVSVLAPALSDGRRSGAQPVGGQQAAFATDLSTVYVPLKPPTVDGISPLAAVTAGIALQAAPTKELIAGIDAQAVGGVGAAALVVAEGRAAMGWAVGRWPALSRDLALLAPGHDAVGEVEDAAELVAMASEVLATEPRTVPPAIFGTLPGLRPLSARRVRQVGDGRRHARMPFSTKRARRRLMMFDMPVGGHEGEAPRLVVLEEAPENEVESSTADRRIGLPYPEWDYRLGKHRDGHVTVLERRVAAATRSGAKVDPRLIRWFAANLNSSWERRLEDGDQLDVTSFVERVADERAGLEVSNRIYQALRPRQRDVATAVLIDATSSLQARGGAAFALELACCDALSAAMASTGERFAVFAYSGETRHRVELVRLRDFTDPAHLSVAAGSVNPSGYSRLGAALRHVTASLVAAPAERRVLLSIGDGRPSDEGYEGTYAEADVLHAVEEANAAGVVVHHIAVGARRVEALERTFGSGRFHHLESASDLPRVLGRVHEELVSQ